MNGGKHRETQRDPEIHRDTERHRETQRARDTQRGKLWTPDLHHLHSDGHSPPFLVACPRVCVPSHSVMLLPPGGGDIGPVGAEEHLAGHAGGVAGLPMEEEQVPGRQAGWAAADPPEDKKPS